MKNFFGSIFSLKIFRWNLLTVISGRTGKALNIVSLIWTNQNHTYGLMNRYAQSFHRFCIAQDPLRISPFHPFGWLLHISHHPESVVQEYVINGKNWWYMKMKQKQKSTPKTTICRTCISASLALFKCTVLAMSSRERVKYVCVNLWIFRLYMDDTTCLASPRLWSWNTNFSNKLSICRINRQFQRKLDKYWRTLEPEVRLCAEPSF
jgi:hypothetical protein